MKKIITVAFVYRSLEFIAVTADTLDDVLQTERNATLRRATWFPADALIVMDNEPCRFDVELLSRSC